MKALRLILLLAVAVTLCSCPGGRKRFRNLDDNIKPEQVNITRMDLMLMNINPAKSTAGLKKIAAEHPREFNLWANTLGYDSTITNYLYQDWAVFLTDTLYKSTNGKVQEVIDDAADIENDISKAYARLHIFYPQIQVPDIFFFISGFNNSIIVGDNLIGVGVDRYLGSDYWVYGELANVYNYQLYGMRRECIAADVVSTTLFQNFPYNNNQVRLLDLMLYYGKMLYLLSVVFPDVKDNEIIEYTPQQWRWCIDNERAAWGALLDNKALFTTDGFIQKQYLFDAPFTDPISPDSPGRMGTWFGYRIINSYMENNTDVTMQELMADNDAQNILQKSGYNP